MTLHSVSLNLDEIKEQYCFLKDLGAQNESNYLKSLHASAFSKVKDTKTTTSLAYLIAFFAFRCKKFEVVSPKDEFGLVVLDISDKGTKEATENEINEALTSLLLECYKNEIYYEKALYQILNDYVNNRGVLDPVPTGNCDMPKIESKGSTEPSSEISQFNKTYLAKNGMHETYNPFTASNYQKLRMVEQIGEFKNAQVKERALKAFKIVHNCEPTKDEAERFKDRNFDFDNTVYTKASAKHIRVG